MNQQPDIFISTSRKPAIPLFQAVLSVSCNLPSKNLYNGALIMHDPITVCQSFTKILILIFHLLHFLTIQVNHLQILIFFIYPSYAGGITK